jgi:hypothetical protein
MQRHSSGKAAFLLGLAFSGSAALALAPGAFAGAALPDRPGFGYAIQFTTGTTAEALLPVDRQPLPDRPGFGYTINFMPGDPADSLYPPGWARQRGMTALSKN